MPSIRITLKKVHSLIEIPRFDQSVEGDLFEEPSNSVEEQMEITWQEKVFSKYEIDYYNIKDNCISELQKGYHHVIRTNGLADKDINGKIFSYTSADDYAPDEELPDLAQINKLHLKEVEADFENMFIMADLDSEVLVCSIKWNQQEKILLIYPDFNCMKINPYYKEIQGDSRQMYHFGIENLSHKSNFTRSQPAIELQNTLMNKLAKLTLADDLSKNNFSYPENRHLRFLIMLEILSALQFPYDNIFVRYSFILPVETKVLDGPLGGSTHSSKKTHGVWNFGHCHELLIDIPESKDVNEYVKIFFNVISIDSWKRERLLGNAYLNMHISPQIQAKTLQCIRIQNNEKYHDKLETYLVGGRRQVKLKEFYGQDDKTVLNRYGSCTEQTGKLNIKYQIIQQHRPKVIETAGRSSRKHGKFYSNVITVEELLSSYHRARERLEEVVNLNY
ncbi:tectonic-like complex member Mks1 isoform X2 [Wyeomyia smithii]|uniref:tectonic-like complex member Mks1 isoform X2 n=1 Tax=Wyeomyia smithii TaxID=174621 RepID=UPI00246822BD|nr:tectonic-like complex member Mks1 isoform X2 [Wyeomyia smithii]